jgi:hypothetical protein
MKKPSTDSTFEIVQEQTTAYDSLGGTRSEKRGYLKISNAFRDNLLRELKGPRLSVLLCLALYAGGKMEAWPSIERIMRDTGYSRTAVILAIDSDLMPNRKKGSLLPGLVQLGYVEKVRSHHNTYKLRAPELSQNAIVDGWDYTNPAQGESCAKQLNKLPKATSEVAQSNFSKVAQSNLKNNQSFKNIHEGRPNNNTIQQAADEFLAAYPVDEMVVDDVRRHFFVFILKRMGISEREINLFGKEKAANSMNGIDISAKNILYTFQRWAEGKVKHPMKYLNSTLDLKTDLHVKPEVIAALDKVMNSKVLGSGDYSSGWEIPAEEGEE